MVSRLFLMLTYLNNWKIVERKYQFESDYNIGVEVLKNRSFTPNVCVYKLYNNATKYEGTVNGNERQ